MSQKLYLATTFVLASCVSSVSPSASPPSTASDVTADAPPSTTRSLAELRGMAAAAYEKAAWSDCAAAYATVLASPEATPDDAYNAACCHALAGDPIHAFDALDLAAAKGMRDVDYLQQDPDLASLRTSARWNETVKRQQANFDAYLATIHRELHEIYQADQADRQPGPTGIDWAVVGPRDKARLARVQEIIAAGEAKVSDDWFHAAMVMQHGEDLAHYDLAHQWALRAAELTPQHPKARWLAAASLDRKLMKQGKPQRYGTQFVNKGKGFELYEVDPSVTDAERKAWNVPTLEDSAQNGGCDERSASSRLICQLTRKLARMFAPAAIAGFANSDHSPRRDSNGFDGAQNTPDASRRRDRHFGGLPRR